MNEISETQSKLDELMNEYEVAVIGENRGRNRSGYSEKADKYYQKRRELKEFVAELEAERRWIPVSERLPDGGHREFYEVACIYQDFGELALFSKGRWVIYEGENEYDVTKRVKFWRKRQYLPDEVIAVLSKGKMNPEVQE